MSIRHLSRFFFSFFDYPRVRREAEPRARVAERCLYSLCTPSDYGIELAVIAATGIATTTHSFLRSQSLCILVF